MGVVRRPIARAGLSAFWVLRVQSSHDEKRQNSTGS
jgi:hypothetical protein